jgi:hypothetical protein
MNSISKRQNAQFPVFSSWILCKQAADALILSFIQGKSVDEQACHEGKPTFKFKNAGYKVTSFAITLFCSTS